MKLYPLMLNIEGKTVVIVGGGRVALRKARDLLEAGAGLKIISPDVHDDIRALKDEKDNSVEIISREYNDGDLEGASLVFSATDDSRVNRNVFLEAGRRGIFINSADDPPNCSFFVPSFFRRGDLILALSTSGASPGMAARLRREIETIIPGNVEEILESLKAARDILKGDEAFTAMTSSMRGSLLKKVVKDDDLLNKLVEAGKNNLIKEFLQNI